MAFIEKDDYGDAIKDNILDDLTEGVDAELDSAEAKAISLMSGYLNNRYDVAQIFAATGDNRNPVILMYAVDISIYLLHRKLSWRDLPTFRSDRYKEAKEWLEKISKLEINDPTLPVITATTDRNYVMANSNPKRINHIDNSPNTNNALYPGLDA